MSFLGFGLPIEVPSWGGMLSREGREFMEAAPRLALWPGLCLTTHRLLFQHVRRRHAGPPRPQAQGRAIGRYCPPPPPPAPNPPPPALLKPPAPGRIPSGSRMTDDASNSPDSVLSPRTTAIKSASTSDRDTSVSPCNFVSFQRVGYPYTAVHDTDAALAISSVVMNSRF